VICGNFVSTVKLLTAPQPSRFLNFVRAHVLPDSSHNDADIASLTSLMRTTRFFVDTPRSADQDNLSLRCLEAADLYWLVVDQIIASLQSELNSCFPFGMLRFQPEFCSDGLTFLEILKMIARRTFRSIVRHKLSEFLTRKSFAETAVLDSLPDAAHDKVAVTVERKNTSSTFVSVVRAFSTEVATESCFLMVH